MALHAFTKPDPENGGFTIRFGFLCDVCGKEIKDPRDGGIDYTCLDPGEAKRNKRHNEILHEKHFPEEDYLDYIVYHRKTCTPKKRHRYWRHLDSVVDQLSLLLTKA